MGSWFVKPETVRLSLPEGQWIEIRKRLNVGESRKAVTSFVGKYNPDGSRTPNLETLGMGNVLAYLLAWSLRDDDDRPVPVDLDSLKNLALDKYVLIETAIEEHVAAVDTEDQDREKKVPASNVAGISRIS